MQDNTLDKSFLPSLDKKALADDRYSDRPVGRAKPIFSSIAFYVFLTSIIIAPLAFIPTPYISLDLTKTIIISLSILISAIFLGISIFKSKHIDLPPKNILYSIILVVISMIVSAVLSSSPAKSLFGQGFEIGTASFIALAFLALIVTYVLVSEKTERAIFIIVGMTASFLTLFIFHLSRVIFGENFATLGILNSKISTVLGSWSDIGTFSLLIAIFGFLAISFLKLSPRLKIAYWLMLLISLFTAFIVNNPISWFIFTFIFVGITIYLSKTRSDAQPDSSLFRKIAIVPLIILILAGLVSWKGAEMSRPMTSKMGLQYSSISLPWQMTLDVAVGVIKERPLFGVGPNRFLQAYLTHKPLEINLTPAWSMEFNYGFGLIPTLIITQGFLGLLSWLMFLIVFVVSGIKVFRRDTSDSIGRFIKTSSFAGASFLWLCLFFTVPSHFITVSAFVLTGIFFAVSVRDRSLEPVSFGSLVSGKTRLISLIVLIVMIVCVVWGIIYTKKFIALAYFGAGVKSLSVDNDPIKADKLFSTSLMFDNSDIYWQARAETGILASRQLLANISQMPPESIPQELADAIFSTVNQSLAFTENAIKYDKTNYYNYVSGARVAELASSIRMENSYSHATSSYGMAISLNRFNPSLYLGLARLHASQGNMEDALAVIGSALQVKNNYLDAIFILSQIEASRGNLKNAITAAEVADQLNPANPVILFQLGLLLYNDLRYNDAIFALSKAVEIQPDYANAKYFLGLSYARLGRNADAIIQFTNLSESNPDNQEVTLILSNLRAGKSPFTNAEPPVTPNPEKRPSLPIDESSSN